MHFAMGRHPLFDQALIVSACSGHGFKFSSALGESIADLVAGRDARFDLEPFRLTRFSSGETLTPVR
jgi:glycine/D-amino acid oxidase-like deaminating enzyme